MVVVSGVRWVRHRPGQELLPGYPLLVMDVLLQVGCGRADRRQHLTTPPLETPTRRSGSAASRLQHSATTAGNLTWSCCGVAAPDRRRGVKVAAGVVAAGPSGR